MFHKAGIKVHYKLTLQSISGVTPGTQFQVSYKRGAKKENHGEFPPLTSSSEGVATFKNATIDLNCTLFKDSTLFEAKSIVFSLKELGDDKKKKKDAIKAMLNLSDYAELMGSTKLAATYFKKKASKQGPALTLKVFSEKVSDFEGDVSQTDIGDNDKETDLEKVDFEAEEKKSEKDSKGKETSPAKKQKKGDDAKSKSIVVKSEVGGDTAKWQAEAEKWKQKYWELKEKNANTMEKLINDKDELESESKAELEKQNNRIAELKKENEKLEQQVDALIEEKKRRAAESSETMTGDEKDKRIAVLEQEKAEMESRQLTARKEQSAKVASLEEKVASLEAQLKMEKSSVKSSSEKKPKPRSHRRGTEKRSSKASSGANSNELKYTEADMTELVNHIEELEDTLDTTQEKMVMQQFFDAMFGSLAQQKLSGSETIPAIDDFFSEMSESGYVEEVNVGKSSWKRLATSFTAVTDHTKTLSSVCYLFAFSLQFRSKVVSVFSIDTPIKPYVTEFRDAPNDYETKEDVFELANYMVSYAYNRLINTLYERYDYLKESTFYVVRPQLLFFSSRDLLNETVGGKKVQSNDETEPPTIDYLGEDLTRDFVIIKDMLEKRYFIPQKIVTQIIIQSCSYITKTILNDLINFPSLCVCGTGIQMKYRIAQLETLPIGTSVVLKPLRQVANLLLMENKTVLLDENLRKTIFSALDPMLIKTIALNFHTDSIQQQPLPESVRIGLNSIVGTLPVLNPTERITEEQLAAAGL